MKACVVHTAPPIDRYRVFTCASRLRYSAVTCRYAPPRRRYLSLISAQRVASQSNEVKAWEITYISGRVTSNFGYFGRNKTNRRPSFTFSCVSKSLVYSDLFFFFLWNRTIVFPCGCDLVKWCVQKMIEDYRSRTVHTLFHEIITRQFTRLN